MAAWSPVTTAPDLGKSGKTNIVGRWQSIFLTFISKAQEAIEETMNYLSEPRQCKPFRCLNNAIPLCGERLHPVLQHNWGSRGQRPKLFSPRSFIRCAVEMTAIVNDADARTPRAPCRALCRRSFIQSPALHQHYPNSSQERPDRVDRWRSG